MPDDPIHPEPLDGEQRFPADLLAHLDSLPAYELVELLAALPRSRQQPLGLAVLMIALNERLPDPYRLLPPAGHPGPGEGRRRSLREVMAARRAARRQLDGPAAGLAGWLADRQRQAERARAGVLGERRVAEALHARAADPDPAGGGRWEPGALPAEPAEREHDPQDQERDREPEDDFGDSWRSYRQRAERIRQTYGWKMPEPPRRVEPWPPLGRDDDQERVLGPRPRAAKPWTHRSPRWPPSGDRTLAVAAGQAQPAGLSPVGIAVS